MTTSIYPCKPQFYYIKVGLKGVNNIKACFRDENGVIISVAPQEYPHLPKAVICLR